MVVLQPFLKLTPSEPYRLRQDGQAAQLAAIDRTLSIARLADHGAGKTHFTVIPEYSIPGLAGVSQIETQLRDPSWPCGTVVIGGIDALAKTEYEDICAGADTFFHLETDGPDQVQGSEWVNCGITWVKAQDGSLRRWLQPKLTAAWQEQNITHAHMFRGGNVFVFRCAFENGVPCRFFSLLCFDWIGIVDGLRVPSHVLSAIPQPEQEVSLSWVFVPQHNERPSHAAFLAGVTEFFDDGNVPLVFRNRCGIVFANTAGRDNPGRADLNGCSGVVLAPGSLYEIGGSPPTYSGRPKVLRGSAALGACKDTIFRERGACIHSFSQVLLVNPTAAGRSLPLYRAIVHSVAADLQDPRAAGMHVPASVKWVNDALDDIPCLSQQLPGAPLAGPIEDVHKQNVKDLRVVDSVRLDQAIDLATFRPKDEKRPEVDEWSTAETAGLQHMVHTLDILRVGGTSLSFATAVLQATGTLRGHILEVVAINGPTHEDCARHIEGRIVVPARRRAVVVTRDAQNAPRLRRERNILRPGRVPLGSESKITDASSALIEVSFREIMDMYLAARQSKRWRMRCMATSHPDGPILERLRDFLMRAFPSGSASTSLAADGNHPLLLLEVRHDLAAFAISNGDPKSYFDQSYRRFKELYSERQREWDKLNLVFVLCLTSRERELEAFCAAVETDVFFCRKFTVALDRDWNEELSRLPFFPLELRRNETLRPPSAQTLLKASGVPAALAAAIVGRVGEETIVEGCLGGRFGSPAVMGLEFEVRGRVETEQGDVIRVQALEIENFRAYRRRQVFDLDANLTILFGPNGFGKTSFFDAFDFVATGDIGRLGLSTREARFTKAARHLDSGQANSWVRLTVRGEDGIHTLQRSVARRRDALLDKIPADRREVMSRLARPRRPLLTDHVDHLTRLFRATHLFSQEAQELTEEFRQHCRLPAEVVSRMLTFEDYVVARRKVEQVVGVFEARRREYREQGEALARQVAAARKELSDIKKGERVSQAPEMLAALREAVRGQLRAAGVGDRAEKDATLEARGWRVSVEAELGQLRATEGRLAGLVERTPLVAAARREMAALAEGGAQRAAAVNDASMRMQQARQRASDVEALLSRLRDRDAELRTQLQGLAWRRETQPTFEALSSRSGELTAEIGELSRALSDRTEALERAIGEAASARSQLTRVEEQAAEVRGRRERVTELHRRYGEHEQRRARQKTVEKSFREATRALEGIGQRRSATEQELDQVKLQERQVSAVLVEVSKSETERQNLIQGLESHVVGPECPACGVRHGSRDEVLNRLREQRGGSPASAAVGERLLEIQRRVKTLTGQLDELERDMTRLRGQVAAASREREGLSRQIAEFDLAIEQLGIPTDRANLEESLQSQIRMLETKEFELSGDLARHREAVSLKEQRVTSIRSEIQSLQLEMDSKAEALRDSGQELNRMRADATRFGVRIDTDDSTHGVDEVAIGREIVDVQTQTSAAMEESNALGGTVRELQRSEQRLKREAATHDAAVRSRMGMISKHEEELVAQGVSKDVDQIGIAERHAGVRGRVSLLEQLKDSILTLEFALDSASRSIAAERLASSASAADRELAKVRGERERNSPWQEYFERLGRKLEETQGRAVSDYTDKYGPITSTIQQRLRSVTGFEEVSLHPEGDRIAIRVARNQEQLPPTDFFSQSQQQILVLSLFLTACITQTWSSFAPILLDDPVTHFDDLNAYSFLDLIDGLLETQQQERQFILSTCDERMFLLARQRFQHLGDGVRFYRFLTCGREGPEVERV